MVEKQIAAQPLQGKRILVTRTPRQAAVLCQRLRELGAIPVEFPTIRIIPPQDWEQLDAALRRLYATDGTGYDWLVFTSANGVNICIDRLRSLGYDPQTMIGIRVAAIGPATATALAHHGITADLVPEEYIAESVAAALIKDTLNRGLSMSGQRILLARAAEARKVLVTELQRAGAQVDEVAGYYTVPATTDDEKGREVLRLLQQRQIDILTFTSSSTVKNFIAWLKSCEQGGAGPLMDLVTQHTQLASIGPITSQTARELGLHVDIEAKSFTIHGLVKAIIQHEETSWQNKP
ncbi:MAG TPA: uroporphyrinogen-III synthase [Ktedonosporobacter sp.]|jgi:uroporphyrinogen-III synthase|nr:uroporphyrinogen-III synthase [Ktedonosporobacter sp.]